MKLNHVAAIVLIGLAGYFYLSKSKPDVPEPPTPTLPAPSAELQALVAPLQQYKGKPNADLAAQFFTDFADVLERDSKGLVRTNGQLRAGLQRAQVLWAERTNIAGSLPGLSAALDDVFSKGIGKEDTAIDRTKAVSLMRAIAWSLQ